MDNIELAGKLAARYLRDRLSERAGVKSGATGQGTKEYLLIHPREVPETVAELDTLVREYNDIPAETDDTKWKALARLKSKVPTLPTLGQISSDVQSNRLQSRWLNNFLEAATTMDSAMAQAENLRRQNPNTDLLTLDLGANALFFGLSKAHPRAKAKAFGWHAYEETVLNDPELCKGQEFRKDEIIDALIEVLIDQHSQQSDKLYALYKIMRDPESAEESTAALGWVEGYDHLSNEILKKAGF